MPAISQTDLLEALQTFISQNTQKGNLVSVSGTIQSQSGSTRILPSLVVPAGQTLPLAEAGQFIYPVIATGPLTVKVTPGGVASQLVQGIGIDFGLLNQFTSLQITNETASDINVVLAIGFGRIIDNRLVANLSAFFGGVTTVINPAVIIAAPVNSGLNTGADVIKDLSGTTVTLRMNSIDRQVFLQNRRCLILSTDFATGLTGPLSLKDYTDTVTIWQASAQFMSVRLDVAGDCQLDGVAGEVAITEIYDGIVTG